MALDAGTTDASIAGGGGGGGAGTNGAIDGGPDGGGPDGSPGACTSTSCAGGDVCDVNTGACVQCLSDDECPGATPACDSVAHACVGCTQSALHCGGNSSLCDVQKKSCVECLNDADCTDATASACKAGRCEPCTTNAECHLGGLTVCDTGSGTGECVQCTGSDYAACPKALDGAQYVCDSAKRTCTTFKEGSAQPCAECVADAQCRPGTACMQTLFGATHSGSYCLWKKEATGSGAPNGSCGAVRPYIAPESGWESVDGKTPVVCKGRATTCSAQNDFSAEACSGVGTSGNAECGVSAVEDGYCAPYPSGGFRCTVPCVSYDDCKVTQGGADMECQSQNLGGPSVDVCQFQ